MTRHTIIIIVASTAIIAALIYSGVVPALILFLLMGIIPGTNYILSATIMIVILSALLGWLILQAFSAGVIWVRRSRALKQLANVKRPFPKRRYARSEQPKSLQTSLKS